MTFTSSPFTLPVSKQGNILITLLVCFQLVFLTRFFILTFKGFSFTVYISKDPQGGEKVNIWIVDSTASTVGFSVPHMMVSSVKGKFEEFSGEIEGDALDLTKSSVQFQVAVRSIQTDNKERDVHLCSQDFF
ncbi:YceI like family protein [Sporosarcina newyorkensis 2681]|uniref:YceI like family protein n=1 Tax=Sporosarcina newyorkensis 2681 TaxID=1027292 RepID=F9DTV2_9BACL|nr:YceI like family protein [Sporosarcina newyorkensis 2681]